MRGGGTSQGLLTHQRGLGSGAPYAQPSQRGVQRTRPTQCQGQHGRVRSCWVTLPPGRAVRRLLALPSVGHARGVGEANPGSWPRCKALAGLPPGEGTAGRGESCVSCQPLVQLRTSIVHETCPETGSSHSPGARGRATHAQQEGPRGLIPPPPAVRKHQPQDRTAPLLQPEPRRRHLLRLMENSAGAIPCARTVT